MSKTSPRIERGAALLDEHAPGWENRIDLDTLDLGDCQRCILGQLYYDYHHGLREIDGDAEHHPARYGFTTHSTERFWGLTWKWHAFIEARRAGRRAA